MRTDSASQFEIRSTYEEVRKVGLAINAVLMRAGNVDESTRYNVELASHEVCTNIVDHAYAGQVDGVISVEIRLRKGMIEIEFRDWGHPFDPGSAQAPDLTLPQEGGYGLFLAHALLDDVHYERRADVNLWRLRKKL